MTIRQCAAFLCVLLTGAQDAFAQNWSFDARVIGLGSVGGSHNLATKMIEEQRDYFSIVLPFGLIQVLDNLDRFNPESADFDLVTGIEDAASPLHFILGRHDSNSGQASFVRDIRNAELSRDLSRYAGFAPANELFAEGLASPNFGKTIKIRQGERGAFQGVYVGAGPYLSMHAAGTIDPGLTAVFASAVNTPNARFPITNDNQLQFAVAVTGGYRGRFAWPTGVGSGSDREGLYLAANVNYLRGIRYFDNDMLITLDTDNAGLITARPASTPVVIVARDATKGNGFAIDVGAGAVINRWEMGVGARGIANRIDWQSVEQTRYTLSSLISGDDDFSESTDVILGDTRVELPVDYRANIAYHADKWLAAAEVGHGFGGASFHGGYERRFGRVELRGGARYTVEKWNPSAGVGFNLSPRVAFDVAVFGTHTNIERKRQTAFAASMRFNRLR